MDGSLKLLKESLHQASEQYRSVICDAKFDYNNWSENVKRLSPIIGKLQDLAVARIDLCGKNIEDNNKKQVTALEHRSELYAKMDADKSQLSDLDVERIRIITEIANLTKEIGDKKKKIEDLQKQIADIKKENSYWDTVFWATCWIPFANIGTGVKKHVEDGKYHAAVKVLGQDIHNNEERINNLNVQQNLIVQKQRENHESSSKLANQIMAAEGGIASITALINELRRELNLWQTILKACSEINVKLQHINGKIAIVLESFAELLKVEELLSLPTTHKYIQGCIGKGDTLSVGQKLNRNEFLISKNRRFVAIMQSDNNFVVYNSEKPLWASGTYGFPGNGYLDFCEDGLVCIKGINSNWNTKRNGAAILIMQDDGNLVTYDKDHHALWASDTYSYANVPSICFG